MAEITNGTIDTFQLFIGWQAYGFSNAWGARFGMRATDGSYYYTDFNMGRLGAGTGSHHIQRNFQTKFFKVGSESEGAVYELNQKIVLGFWITDKGAETFTIGNDNRIWPNRDKNITYKIQKTEKTYQKLGGVVDIMPDWQWSAGLPPVNELYVRRGGRLCLM